MKIEPGVYKNIPYEEYAKWDALNYSGMKLMQRTPAHYAYSLTEPRTETPALRIGTCAHELLLNKGSMGNYACAPDVDRRTKAGKEKYAAFLEESNGKTPISHKELQEAMGIYTALARQEAVSTLIAAGVEQELAEVSVVAEIEAACGNTVLVKGRLDLVNPDLAIVVDLKTTQDCSRNQFERSIFNYGYYIQAGLYLELAKKVDPKINQFCIIAVESSAPHVSKIYRIEQDVIDLGLQQANRLASIYYKCRAEKRWPSYTDEVENVGLPQWAKNQIYQEMGIFNINEK